MKPVRVETHRRIRVPQQRVFQLLSRVEGLPRYADLWLAADVLERSGGQVVAEFRGYFGGLPIDSVQRVSLRPTARMEFRQVSGTLKALRGEFVVEADGGGSRLTARMEVDAGIPMLLEEAVRRVLTTALERMVTKVRDAAERDLPRLIPRRPAAPAALHAAEPAAPQSPARLEVPVEELPGEVAPVEGPPVETAAPPTAAPPTGAAPPAPARVAPPATSGARPGRRRRRRRHRRGPPGPPPGPGTAPGD
jgi:ribosome-associated toxin RatA of RatAB toxin-antitoxin module